jgi:hypothetical protein
MAYTATRRSPWRQGDPGAQRRNAGAGRPSN